MPDVLERAQEQCCTPAIASLGATIFAASIDTPAAAAIIGPAMKLKKGLVAFGVIASSGAIGLLLCEVAARVVLNPADYLSVEMVNHDVMGAVPSADTKAGGFDRWGFRNREVPASADIVAIGDSHTYGNAVPMEDSWPYVLGRLTGQRVYNMGLGGYGPTQYFALLAQRAVTLKPRLVMCGVYMGDDFENAFQMTYGLDHWAALRERPTEKVNFDIWKTPSDSSWHKPIRLWLSRHSITYQLLVHGPLRSRLIGDVQIRNAPHAYEGVVVLSVPEKDILEAFLPGAMLGRLDQSSPSVREGMRITFRLLEEMHQISLQNHVQFVVLVIPTKEMVFSEYFEPGSRRPLSAVLHDLLANERAARETMFKFLTDSAIPYVDVAPALTRAVGHRLYARSANDMHPNKNGYRIIAEAVRTAMQRNEPTR